MPRPELALQQHLQVEFQLTLVPKASIYKKLIRKSLIQLKVELAQIHYR